MSWFDSNNMIIMQRTMDYLWARQRVVSNNIANADTPGYKAQSLSFEGALAQAIQSGDGLKERLANLQPMISENPNLIAREDGNNVDINAENIELARVQLQYEYMTRQISDNFSRLRYVINGGKG